MGAWASAHAFQAALSGGAVNRDQARDNHAELSVPRLDGTERSVVCCSCLALGRSFFSSCSAPFTLSLARSLARSLSLSLALSTASAAHILWDGCAVASQYININIIELILECI
jgi:hypothetical protein